MNEIITIDPKEMKALAVESGKFIFKPKAEESLLKLHEMIVMLQALEDSVKEAIGKAGKELNPNFKGVIGENVKCIYRKYGAKYEYDWKNKEGALPFLKKKEYYSVDTDKVDKYVKEVGELPEGISEKPREDVLSIIYGEQDEENTPVAQLDTTL
jgi:hypothetical protein